MSSVTLNTGASIPAFGLGTWQSPKGAVGKAVEIAIRAGYRHIDCAHLYENEDEVGEVLQKLFKEGVVKREDLYITSKLSCFLMSNKEDVTESLTDTLTKLQLDYLDLYLIHCPFAAKKGTPFMKLQEGIIGYFPDMIASVWETMEGFVAKGLTKAIGISNFSITKTENLLKTAKIVPAVNQVECHAYLQQTKLQQYCKSKGIAFEAYSPLGSPARFNVQPGDPVVMEDPAVKEIASKHGASPAQVCIAFLLQSGLVVIPKSVTESRIIENLKATELVLTDEEMKKSESY
uniref:NADP-dependent oxidoreductase domain-containing protein n=1 Tax=Amphimedon queenslandica TaxID=400682 RepID=A0A1X7VUX6_AMPQE